MFPCFVIGVHSLWLMIRMVIAWVTFVAKWFCDQWGMPTYATTFEGFRVFRRAKKNVAICGVSCNVSCIGQGAMTSRNV